MTSRKAGPMSNKLWMFTAFAALSGMIGPLGAQAPTFSRSGVLNCRLAPSIGLIIGSHQVLACRFVPDRGRPENYAGSMTTLGLDIGFTAGGAMAWAVLLSTNDPYPGFLAGTYVGASGDI